MAFRYDHRDYMPFVIGMAAVIGLFYLLLGDGINTRTTLPAALTNSQSPVPVPAPR